MSRPIVAIIDQQALRNNLEIVRRVAPNTHIWSVIKANAYGHGIKRVWKNLAETDGFAVLNIEEAILLREIGWKKPILLLEGFFKAEDLALIDRYRLTTSIHNDWQITELANASISAPLDIYVKVNSGMNRLGFQFGEVSAVWGKLRRLKNVGKMTLMAHFAQAENADGIVKPLKHIVLVAEGLGCALSLSNSACTLWHPEAHFDWIRPGIALYGASPSGAWHDIIGIGLQPVMTLRSEIIAIQQLHPGDYVGYGHRYHTQRSQRIGVVACGYADGYPRHAPDGTPVAVDGLMTQVVGPVSMDMMTIDLSPCPQAGLGSVVELWGKQVKIDLVAKSARTLGYELMCALSSRVPVQVI